LEVDVQALVFRHSLAREAASAIGGRLDRRAFVSRLAPVRLEDVDELPLPSEDWVRVETIFSGLCGSDVKQILLNGARDNPLTALVSFPHVLGHEAVGRRADTGERVVLNPWLSCGPRGIEPPCEACAAGRYPWCRNFRSGNLPVSIHIGNCAAATGAHAERFSAHGSQLFAIPDQVSDEAAVLADPVSVSLRSILLAPPPAGQAVLVYGSGTLAFAAIALLRHLYPAAEVWAATRPGPRAGLATRLGAHAALSSTPDELIAQVARRVGTTADSLDGRAAQRLLRYRKLHSSELCAKEVVLIGVRWNAVLRSRGRAGHPRDRLAVRAVRPGAVPAGDAGRPVRLRTRARQN